MVRNILAVVTGLIAAIVVFVIVESVNALIHPGKELPGQPISFWIMVLAGWFIGSVLGGFLIRCISRSGEKKLPVVAGSILTASAIVNFFSHPHPTWFIIIGLLIFIPATLFGHQLYKKHSYGQR